MWRALVNLFGLIDAPPAGPFYPATHAGDLDPTPVAGAGANFAHYLGLQLGHDLGRRGGRLVQAGDLRGDDEAALARQQALMDPAAGPLPIADFAPILVFGDDFDRHGLAFEHPIHRIAAARAGADIDLVRPQRGEARNWQTGSLALGRRRFVGRGMRAASQ